MVHTNMANDKSPFSGPGWESLTKSLSSNLPNLAEFSDSYATTMMNFRMPVIRPISVQQAESFEKGIANVIEELQANLAQDEELLVYYSNGVESVRMLHLYMSSTNVAVISGVDAEGNQARVVAHFQALQFVCKVVKVGTEKPKIKIGFAFER